MRSLFNLSLLTSIFAVVLASFIGATLFNPIVCSFLFLLVFLSRDDHNSLLLTVIFAMVFVLDSFSIIGIKYLIFPYVTSNFIQNVYAFGSQLILSIFLLILLKYRMTVAVFLTRGKSASVFEKNYAEGPLYLLVIILVLVDFFALIENFIRNLDRMGVSEEVAKAFWEWTFFYDYFEYLKAVPIFLCIALLYVGLVVRTKRKPIQN
ncbi:hypothetical protein [Pseudoalteromonas sp. XMcav11-Q]|uniref:hypothetical protein n=1 Tax=Pseudoalteromonas sp. XMcav11-Q TaxID=3136665 RepID=UPI0032C49F93